MDAEFRTAIQNIEHSVRAMRERGDAALKQEDDYMLDWERTKFLRRERRRLAERAAIAMLGAYGAGGPAAIVLAHEVIIERAYDFADALLQARETHRV